MPRWTSGVAPRDWTAILADAEAIALGYNTPVTLRQLHYRLVASGVGNYVNSESCYQNLSKQTSKLRRIDAFPSLADLTRGVDRPNSWSSPDAALASLASQYRRDRTEGQRYQLWVIFEKATLGAQISLWTEEYGIPTAALRGYSSESLEREVFDAIDEDGRPAVAFYVGDLDPEGEDIERNFLAQAAAQGITFVLWERLGVLPAQITDLGLVANPGKASSHRAAGFIARYGTLFQIEAEAIDPAVLEQLVVDAITDPNLFDVHQWEASKSQEAEDIDSLQGPQEAP